MSTIYYASISSLKLYTSYLSKDPVGATEYYITQLKGINLTSDIKSFRQSIIAFRNARE